MNFAQPCRRYAVHIPGPSPPPPPTSDLCAAPHCTAIKVISTRANGSAVINYCNHYAQFTFVKMCKDGARMICCSSSSATQLPLGSARNVQKRDGAGRRIDYFIPIRTSISDAMQPKTVDVGAIDGPKLQ